MLVRVQHEQPDLGLVVQLDRYRSTKARDEGAIPSETTKFVRKHECATCTELLSGHTSDVVGIGAR